MFTVLTIVPKAKLYQDLALFHNHSITFLGLIVTVVAIAIICFICGAFSSKLQNYIFIGWSLCVLCIPMFIPYSTDTPGAVISNHNLVIETKIRHNLHKVHTEKHNLKHIHSSRVKHSVNNMIGVQEYYNDTHIKNIKAPAINHNFIG